MPELPEVEMVARSLRPHVEGRLVRRVETSGLSLRRPIDRRRLARACVGQRILAVRRVAKYLIFELSGDEVLLAHLGMSGRYDVVPRGAARAAHTHAVLHLDDDRELRYVDPRRFGLLRVYPWADLAQAEELRDLGADPLAEPFTVAALAAIVASTRGVALKPLLLDQKRIAGLGNIYASEALHRARLSPRRRADRTTGDAVARLHEAIRAVLNESIARGGTTLRDYLDANGAVGDNQRYLSVYGREGEPCRRCGTPIRGFVQGGRSTFYCPRCQR